MPNLSDLRGVPELLRPTQLTVFHTSQVLDLTPFVGRVMRAHLIGGGGGGGDDGYAANAGDYINKRFVPEAGVTYTLTLGSGGPGTSNGNGTQGNPSTLVSDDGVLDMLADGGYLRSTDQASSSVSRGYDNVVHSSGTIDIGNSGYRVAATAAALWHGHVGITLAYMGMSGIYAAYGDQLGGYGNKLGDWTGGVGWAGRSGKSSSSNGTTGYAGGDGLLIMEDLSDV